MANNRTLTYRVGELEKCVEKMDAKMDNLMTNHLPHMQQEISSMKVRITLLTAINVGAILLVATLLKFI